ncbi:unnamed protein product, partial [Urochloa humidicola]
TRGEKCSPSFAPADRVAWLGRSPLSRVRCARGVRHFGVHAPPRNRPLLLHLRCSSDPQDLKTGGAGGAGGTGWSRSLRRCGAVASAVVLARTSALRGRAHLILGCPSYHGQLTTASLRVTDREVHSGKVQLGKSQVMPTNEMKTTARCGRRRHTLLISHSNCLTVNLYAASEDGYGLFRSGENSSCALVLGPLLHLPVVRRTYYVYRSKPISRCSSAEWS